MRKRTSLRSSTRPRVSRKIRHVFPFFFLSANAAVFTSLACSAAALFLIGAGITLLTGRSVWYSGVRQLLFGVVAAGLTYGVGRLLGAQIAG